MTNGEMIQKVFNCEVCEPILEEDIIHVIFPDKNDSAIGFDWSWWNMEYKDPTTKNDLGVDCRSLEDIKKLVERKADALDGVMLDAGGVIIGLYFAIANDLTPVTPQELRWIPVDDPYTELPKKDLWVTRSDNGNLWVDRICYDMTEWSDYIGDVVAYMEYKEPAPYKEVIEE